jgi:hypothetical protein
MQANEFSEYRKHEAGVGSKTDQTTMASGQHVGRDAAVGAAGLGAAGLGIGEG